MKGNHHGLGAGLDKRQQLDGDVAEINMHDFRIVTIDLLQ